MYFMSAYGADLNTLYMCKYCFVLFLLSDKIEVVSGKTLTICLIFYLSDGSIIF